MPTITKQHLSRLHKRDLVLVIAVLCVAMLILGTFAWTSFQYVVNQVFGEVAASVELEVNPWYDPGQNPEWNADIHVVNTGQVDMMVRIRLSEIKFKSSSLASTTLDSIINPNYKISYNDIRNLANINWETRLEIDDWEWSVHGLTYGPLIGVPEENAPAVPDINGYVPVNRWVHPILDPALPDPFGGFYASNYTSYAEMVASSGYVNDPPRWQWTSTAMMTFDEWVKIYNEDEDDPRLVDKWVLCDDGYFYYTSLLYKMPPPAEVGAPPHVTTVLIDNVFALFDIRQFVYYYAINVEMDAVTQQSLHAWVDGGEPNPNPQNVTMVKASPQGQWLLWTLFPDDYDMFSDTQPPFPTSPGP
ncbi:MAG: hypothetical protein FWG78_03305 [Coriobacteriia bacterium]|nr:hypothetical protein [Coriobacteriia bacterium]